MPGIAIIRKSSTAAGSTIALEFGADSDPVGPWRLHIDAVDAGCRRGAGSYESSGIFEILSPQPNVPLIVGKNVGQHQIGLGRGRLIGCGRMIENLPFAAVVMGLHTSLEAPPA